MITQPTPLPQLTKVSHRLVRKPHRRLATVPFVSLSSAQRAHPDDFLSLFLIDAPIGGFETCERFTHRRVELDEQRNSGSVQSYPQYLTVTAD